MKPETKLFKQLVKKTGMTLNEFAMAVGKKQPEISRYNTGKILPPLRKIEEMANKLGYRVEEKIMDYPYYKRDAFASEIIELANEAIIEDVKDREEGESYMTGEVEVQYGNKAFTVEYSVDIERSGGFSGTYMQPPEAQDVEVFVDYMEISIYDSNGLEHPNLENFITSKI